MDIYGFKKINQVIGHKCDTCGNSTEKGNSIPIRIEFSYGHDLDGAYYDFCNYQCLLKFILGELRKENPRPIIEGQNQEE